MKPEEILFFLKIPGRRISPILKTLIEELSDARSPLSVDDLVRKLSERGLTAHKSTIMRQLQILTKSNDINEVFFGDRKIRYQLGTPPYHKHYLVCENCGAHESFGGEMKFKPLHQQLAGQTGYKVKRHAITYFGLCPKCRPGGVGSSQKSGGVK